MRVFHVNHLVWLEKGKVSKILEVHYFFEIERIVNEKRPKVLFLENVAGIVSHDGGRTLRVIEENLVALGYFFRLASD